MIKTGKYLINLKGLETGLFTFEISLNKSTIELNGTLETIKEDLKELDIFEVTTKENLLKGLNHLISTL
jgi:hypothetical protein